jgi:hypothetical protein
MIISEWYHVPALASLGVIAVALAVTVVLSLRATPPTVANPSEVHQ